MPGDSMSDDGVEIDAAIVAEQIRLLLHGRFDLPINLLNAGIVSAALWPLYPGWVVLTWLTVFVGVILVRSIIRGHYAIAAPGIDTARRWARVFTLNACATGLLWGLTASAILLKPDPVYELFVVFLLGGMMAGGIVTNSAYKPTMLAFLVPTILPAIVILLSRGDLVHIEMGVMLGAFTAVLMIAGRNINQSIVENFRLRIGERRLTVQLRTSAAAMAEAQSIAHVGSGEFDARTSQNTWSPETFRILGLDPQTTKPSQAAFMARVHPDDRASADIYSTDLLAAGTNYEMNFRIVMDDGTVKWVHRMAQAVKDAAGRTLRVIGTLQDISERMRGAEDLAYRDRLLHAITTGAGNLIKSASLAQGMPQALRLLGESLAVDRVLMFEECASPAAPVTLRYSWEAQGIPVHYDPAALVTSPAERAAVAAWRAPLAEGRPVISHYAASAGPIRALMERVHNQSMLLVPLFAGSRLWGNLGIDACTVARVWTPNEIDTLRTFADIVGSLILRSEERLLLKGSEERFRVLSTTAQDAIITIDGTGRIGTWNAGAARTLGYSSEEAVGRQVHELLAPPRFRSKSDPAMKVFAATGKGDALGKITELAARKKDGTEIAIELSIAGAHLGEGWEAIGILRDVTARKSAEATLLLANVLLKTQMEASLDGILVVDANLKIISFNQRFADIWNVPQAALAAGDDTAVLAQVASSTKDPQQFIAQVNHLYTHPGEDSRDEYRTTDGRYIDRYTVTLYAPSKQYLGRAWFFRDVTERKLAEAHALRMARFDVLTGLANRSVFVEALQRAIAAAKRGEKGFSVLYLDLDHFKDVNDTQGHPVGDELLKVVAQRLRSNTRESDTVARFGGDEFAVVVTDSADPASAAFLADKLIKAIGAPIVIQGSDLHSGASIGISTYGPDAADAETLLSHADVALYRAKSEGRNGYRFFTAAMDTEVQNRVTLGAELRDAVDLGQLFLLYQPQVEIDTGRITGVEALVRWRHPRRGVLGPGLFIPIAEQIGIIGKLGHWVLWTACRQAKAWLDAGIAPVRMSVNVSALQFRTSIGLQADITKALVETGLPPQWLELELTESVLMDASREHNDVIQHLRATGITVAIDDFGTGYSSLEYLRKFPSDRIKIAQNFVVNLLTTPGDAAIVRATIGLAHELGIAVIAEGAETRQQVDLLQSWGCNEVQGYYFAKPLAAAEATAALRAGVIPRHEAA